jgi:hypothetical protein
MQTVHTAKPYKTRKTFPGTFPALDLTDRTDQTKIQKHLTLTLRRTPLLLPEISSLPENVQFRTTQSHITHTNYQTNQRLKTSENLPKYPELYPFVQPIFGAL